MREDISENLRKEIRMEHSTKEVRYDKYCASCKYFEDDEQDYDYDGPCNECLNTPVRYDSSRPLRWAEK